jgi:hypothetical protein
VNVSERARHEVVVVVPDDYVHVCLVNKLKIPYIVQHLFF